MKMSFRWYGPDDPVILQQIRQIPGMKHIVSAVYDVPVGQVWNEESIVALQKQCEENGLLFDLVESVPVHEDIKLGLPTREKYIENYCENIRRLARHGVKCICYNFMPIFDWIRTDVHHKMEDGAENLIYDTKALARMDPLTGELSLPGWDSSYRKEDLHRLFSQYAQRSKENLWENLCYFLQKVIPVAEENDVKMAIHPDDPPWDIFGLPRLITDEAAIDRFLSLYDSPYNGLTFCTGSLGCSKKNNIVKMAEKYSAMGRIHFVHLRNVKWNEDGGFEESGHLTAQGSLDMAAIVGALKKTGFSGYIRPDHGRMIWGETGKPGYGLYDRALGAMYIQGLWEGVRE